jgi:hypothetical protein
MTQSAFMQQLEQPISFARATPNFEKGAIYDYEGRHVQFQQYLPEGGLHFVDLRPRMLCDRIQSAPYAYRSTCLGYLVK